MAVAKNAHTSIKRCPAITPNETPWQYYMPHPKGYANQVQPSSLSEDIYNLYKLDVVFDPKLSVVTSSYPLKYLAKRCAWAVSQPGRDNWQTTWTPGYSPRLFRWNTCVRNIHEVTNLISSFSPRQPDAVEIAPGRATFR